MTRSQRPEPLLLDTHVWVWTAEGARSQVAEHVVEDIETAARNGSILIHPISIWEIGTLVRKNRLTFSIPVRDWVERALALPGVFLLGLDPEAALEAALLPTNDLTDPADRMLVASARVEGAILVTADRRIQAYARHGDVRVLSAR